jgi:hypothetical protein
MVVIPNFFVSEQASKGEKFWSLVDSAFREAGDQQKQHEVVEPGSMQ